MASTRGESPRQRHDIVDSPDGARVTGTTVRSVSRWLEGASPRRPTEERLRELKSLLDLVRRVLREEPARLWMRSPNPAAHHLAGRPHRHQIRRRMNP
ncbi:MAG: hypothetical protein H0V96_04205 [Acidimicrobiia bacterium]|nr:hypothetical protein [Acidimicrobiia bacterium]